MALLMEGQQYGLSSNKNSGEKTLVFVKLTDSALKSIEEYFTKSSEKEILFNTKNGLLQLPYGDSSGKSYGFTLSNIEADGLQGSFECLQQNRSKSLESLGSMLLKMHINANEESYEKTRVKMAAVEKENKKYCTKEIKPSSPHFSQKVKVKRPMSSIPPRREGPSYSTSRALSKPFANSTSVSTNSSFSKISAAPRPVAPPPIKPVKNPELLKQNIRDRIIHILALRPYKKPELMARLNAEGIKEKDKNKITSVLSQVAHPKGNSYTLANHGWKDVQDTWKFYTPSETEQVRKNKLKSLSGANESGTSPTEVTPTSPVQKRTLVGAELSENEQRNKKQRVSHYNKADAATTNSLPSLSYDADAPSLSGKPDFVPKQNGISNGVSLSRRAVPELSAPKPLSMDSKVNGFHIQRSDTGEKVNGHHPAALPSIAPSRHRVHSDFKKYHIYPQLGSVESNQSNPVAKSSTSNLDSKSCSINGLEKTSTPLEADNPQYSSLPSDARSARQNHQPSNQNHRNGITSEEKPVSKSHPHAMENINGFGKERTRNKVLQPADSSQATPNPHSNHHSDRGAHHRDQSLPKTNGHHQNGYHNMFSQGNVTSTNGTLGMSPFCSSDGENSIDYNDNKVLRDSQNDEHPEYLVQYVPIASRGQRAQYKADFNQKYEEYKVLHDRVKGIANRFDELENRLNSCDPHSIEFRTIQGKILQEYKLNAEDPTYQSSRARLNYLHAKLSHIKQLVMDYDRSFSSNS